MTALRVGERPTTTATGQSRRQRVLAAAVLCWVLTLAASARAQTSTFVRAPYDIVLTNLHMVAETPASATETDLRFATDLLNTSSAIYTNLSVNLDASRSGVSFTAVDPILDFAALPAHGTALAGPDTLTVRTANTNVALLRSNILSGALLYVTAHELVVFAVPTKFIDRPTDLAYAGRMTNLFGQWVLSFTNATALLSNLHAGEFLIADPNPGGYRPMTGTSNSLVQNAPFEVQSILLGTNSASLTGRQRELTALIQSGTFIGASANFNGSGRDLYDPPLENTYTAEEQAARELEADLLEATDPADLRLAALRGLNARPWHFNDVRFGSVLSLSGEVLLRSSPLSVQVSFRNFGLDRFSLSSDLTIVANLTLETLATNLHVGGEQTLAHLDLPPFEFNIGGVPCQVAPAFDLRVGAQATGPEHITIPIRSSIVVGSEVGWTSADGAYFKTPTKTFTAPYVSDPTAFSSITASASAWAEAAFSVKVGVYGGLLEAGPTLTVRTEGAFSLAPFANPWWNLDLSASLLGGLVLDSFGVPLANTQSPISMSAFFHRDAGGTLVGTVPESVRTNNLAPKTSRNVRWAQAFQATHNSDSGIYDNGFIVPLPDGGCVIGGSSHFMGYMARLTGDGDFVWLQNTERVLGFSPKDAVLLPDGTVGVAGQSGLDWWVASFDLDGNRRWATSVRPTGGGTLERMSLGQDASGQPALFVAGSAKAPVLLTFSTSGAQSGAWKFALSDYTLAHSVLGLHNGGCVLVGRSDADITNGLLGDYGWNALITRLNADYTVAWTKILAGSTEYWDVAEGPDGALYAVGNGGDTIRNRHPDILVTKFSPAGEILGHVVIGEDPDWPSEFTNRLDTPLDTAWQVKWTANGLIVVGSTGLGPTARGWVAQLTEELGVSWFTSFDNGFSAMLYDIAPTANGLYTLGWSSQIWPTLPGADHNGILLLNLPWEGLMRFQPDSGLQARHVQPRIFECTGSSDFLVGANAVFSASPTFTVSNLTATASTVPAPATFTNVTSVRIEQRPNPQPGRYADWLTFYGLTGADARPSADPDGDGLTNAAEYFFGGNPLVADSAAARLSIDYRAENNTVGLEFQRSQLAVDRFYQMQASSNLVQWWGVTNANVQTISTANRLERLRLTFPGPAPAAHFRLNLGP